MKKLVAVGVIAAASGMAQLAVAQSVPLYSETHAISLGAPDRWDYVFYDASAHRVYIAHGTGVSVVDIDQGKVIGQIEGIPGGTHGIAVVPEVGKGYTDDGEAGQIKVFDLKTLKVVKTIKGQADADGMVLDTATRHLFVVNGDSGTLSVVDPENDSIVATVSVGSKLEAAVGDGAGTIYVDGAEKRELIRIDARTNAVTATWPIPNCESPHGIAIDTKRKRVFVSCVNEKLVAVDATTGREISALPIGKGTDAAGFDPIRQRIFSSNGRDGTLSVIEEGDGENFRAISTMRTAVTGRTMDVDPVSGTVFIAAAQVDQGTPAVNGRPRIVPGSLKLLVFSPAP